MNSRPIGVFDSGIGGLTVVRSLIERLPNENIVYFGDTARVPYGPKSAQTVREYAAQDTDFLLKHNVKMIVIACNTVSAVALDVVQKHAKMPVVGVIIPGAKIAAAVTRKKRIGVIGTLTTVASNAYANALRQIDRSLAVVSRACPLFVPLVEEGWIDHPATAMIAKEYLFPLKLEKVDTLILGCTHYPMLKGIVQRTMEDSVTLIDSGEAAAAEADDILKKEGLRNSSNQRGNIRFFLSDMPQKFAEIGERFLGRKMGRVSRAEGLW